MRIDSSDTKRPCTSCQMCSAVCPQKAITVNMDLNGFYRPVINYDLCVDCGLCSQVCYKYDDSIKITSEEELRNIYLYAASALDDELVAETTSGGVADLLAKELINQGFKVIGVAYNYENDRAESKIATSSKETDCFRGSKYIQSFTEDAFKELVIGCKNEKYAVFGLPCHIYAINRFLLKNHLRENCILIDLYCHGCPSMLVWDKVITKIKKQLHTEKLDFINFRSKKKGWGQFVIYAKYSNKIYHSTPISNEFYDMFFSNHVLNDSCKDCKLRSTLAYTDIRLGDFWGPLFKSNNRGVSGVSVVTQSGQKLFSKIEPMISSKKSIHDELIPYQSWGHDYIINQQLREHMLKSLSSEKSIEVIAKDLNHRLSLKQKTKRILKTIYFFFK